MKVYIGPYTDWFGPYHIADKVFFWIEKWPSDELEQRWDYRMHDKFGDWLAGTWVNDFCNWIRDKRGRKVEVRIDRYDTWSMDHTLALIVHPMLVQLKEIHYGSPYIDDEDVPDELKSTAAPPLTQEEIDFGGQDSNFHKRWDYVLDQMIWSFEQKMSDDSDDLFFKDGFDKEGYDEYQVKIKNGFRLFGKYYQALWD